MNDANSAISSSLSSQLNVQFDMLQMQVVRFWKETLQEPRYQEPKRLQRFGKKIYSQQDEDGIIEEILRRLGRVVPQTFIEFGVEDGRECNSLKLLLEGWIGLWLEGDPMYVQSIQSKLSGFIKSNRLRIGNHMVTKSNVNQIFAQYGLMGDIGMLSIDIDGNDIWVWEAISIVRPAIFICEFNSTWAPPLSVAQPSDDNIYWQGTNYFGCSLSALNKISVAKGYQLVGCNFSGVNAFFVRSDLCGDKFHLPATAEELYEPPRYWMRHLKSGHRAGIGPLVNV
jgi:hypothetical protein